MRRSSDLQQAVTRLCRRPAVAAETSLVVRLRAFAWALNLTRFNLILLLMTGVLLSAGQGQDLLLTHFQDGGGKWGILFGGTLLWAASTWLWARVLLDIECPDAPVSAQQMLVYRKYLPRGLGLLAFMVVIASLYRACGPSLPIWLMLGEAAVFFLLLWKRRPIGRWLASRRSPTDASGHWAWAEPHSIHSLRHEHASLSCALAAPRGHIALFTVLSGVLLFAWGIFAPLSLGRTLDSLLMLMLWGAAVLPLGSLLTYWSNRSGFPVVSAVLLLVLIFSLSNDNHAIRLLPESLSPNQRPQLAEALADWRRRQCDATSCPPFLLAASAGGGIRAAYWTGTVLSRLHDQALTLNKDFKQQLFAISGVSGGALGAVIYHTAARAGSGPLEPLVDRILSQDYLGPVSAGLLFPDALQRLLPWPLLPDRAAIFEQGLEAGFHEVIAQGAGLTGSFIEAGQDTTTPALFLNATWSDNGRRIVAASLQTPEQMLFKDLLNSLGSDLRLSTAAHNSARFPLISPPGGWSPVDAPAATMQQDQVDWQRLQDGGLFENFGAETALEILQFAARDFLAAGYRLNPMVMLISSTPDLPADLAEFPYNPPLPLAYETLSTLRSYATSRTGRGAEAASRLQAWTETHSPLGFVHFRMCPQSAANHAPPLGWALSASAQREIKTYLDSGNQCRQANREALHRVLDRLRSRASSR